MHERIFNEFLLAQNRLQRVLIHWRSLEPRFAAKKTALLSPDTKSLLILSLKQQHQHVAQALRKLYEVKACWDAYKKMAICFESDFFNEARVKVANSMVPQGAKVIDHIEILLLEFQNPLTAPLPFNDLPYEFQKRLIQLFPPKDVTSFKSAGNTAFKAVKKHRSNCNFVHSLYLVYFKYKLKEILSSKKPSHKVIDKVAMDDVDIFEPEMAPYYVGTTLSIYLGSEEAYSKAMEFISGDFETIKILGAEISWKQAFNLIYKSPYVRHVSYRFGDAEKAEYNDFYNAMILLLQNRNIELLVFYYWQWHFPFLEEFRALLNRRDSNLGYFLHIAANGKLVIVSKFLTPMKSFMKKFYSQTVHKVKKQNFCWVRGRNAHEKLKTERSKISRLCKKRLTTPSKLSVKTNRLPKSRMLRTIVWPDPATSTDKNLPHLQAALPCAKRSLCTTIRYSLLKSRPQNNCHRSALFRSYCEISSHPTMHERIYNDFVLAEHRLQRVLIQWILLQPRFTAKKTASLSSETRSLLILSLKQQHQYLTQALRKLYEVKACWDAYKKVDFCFELAFFKKARVKVANSIEPHGVKIQNEIEIFLLEFQNPFTTRVPFIDLPYEYQKRLVQLLPPKDVTTFKSAGNTAFKAVKKYRSNLNFVNSLFVVYFVCHLKEIRASKKPSYKVINKIAMVSSTFLKSKMAPCYVGSEVSIHLDSQEAYFKALELISGNFERISIYGMEISWRQAFKLIYKSQCVKNVLFEFGLFGEDEYTAFFDAMISLLKNGNIELLIFRHWDLFPFYFDMKTFLNNLNSRLGFYVLLHANQIIFSKFLPSRMSFMDEYCLKGSLLI